MPLENCNSVTSERNTDTPLRILNATERVIASGGIAGLSTRLVAEEAAVPLSQIHYHFGSKKNLMLATLEYQNRKLLDRQKTMFGAEEPLSKRWAQACDFLEDDLRSGYVRMLQEMIAAGWSDPEIGNAVRTQLNGWHELLTRVASDAATDTGGLGGFTPDEIGALIGSVFLGAEQYILLGYRESDFPVRSALRKIGTLLARLE
jgi:AcrR family transcriptional regulator